MTTVQARGLLSIVLPFAVFLGFVLFVTRGLAPWHGVVDYSDGAYIWPQSGFDFLTTWNASNLGFPFVAQSFTAFQYLPSVLTQFLTHVGANGPALHAYVLYSGPIYLCCLCVFFLTREASGSDLYGYFAGFFLLLNNFMLEQLMVWPMSYFYCLAGILLQLLAMWRIYQSGPSPMTVGGAVLAALPVHHPFMFIVMMTFQACLLAFIVARGRSQLLPVLLIPIGSVAMQSYWFAPFVYNLLTSSVAETHRASGDSAYWGYMQTITYRNLFDLLNYPMYVDPRVFEAVHDAGQTAFNYLVVGLAVMMCAAAIARRAPKLPEILFFLGVYLLFFNVALGPNSQLTGLPWQWAYVNVPGFAFFRSFDRFNIVALLALLLLGAFLIGMVPARTRAAVLVLLMGMNLVAYRVMLSGDLNGMLAAARVPAEYYRANARFFPPGNDAVMLSLPSTPYEAYTWTANHRNDITNMSMYFAAYFFNVPVIFNQYANMLPRQYPAYNDVLAFYYDAPPVSRDAIDEMRELGVTHVFVHKDRLDSLRKDDRVVPSTWVLDQMKASDAFVLREDNIYFAVFELRNPRPLVRGAGVTARRITQSHYEVIVKDLRQPIRLELAQSFNRDWKLYPARAAWRGGFHLKNRLFLSDIPFLAASSLFDGSHRVVEGFANGWTIDPGEIRLVAPPSSYVVNADGSIDARLDLYFRPQALLTLGFAMTAIVCLVTVLGMAFGQLQAARRQRL